MARKPLDLVPFDPRTGNLDTYPRSRTEWQTGSEWRPNEPFEAALRIVGTERGRSAAHFIAEHTETGVRYTVFMTDLLHIVQNGVIERGVISGTWVGCKRGQNYGIRLVTEDT